MQRKVKNALIKAIDQKFNVFDRYYRGFLTGLAIGIILFVVILAIIYAPPLIIAQRIHSIQGSPVTMSVKDWLDAENALRTVFVQVFGGLGLFAGFYYTGRNLRVAEKNAEIARDGQITDRYTKAIDQFASDKGEVRLGGIYALERIARESPVDHWPIVKVLCTFLREHANFPPEEASKGLVTNPGVIKMRHEMLTILQVLGNRNRENEAVGRNLSLHWLYLEGIDVEKGDFEAACFQGSNLSLANFQRTKLDCTDFLKTRLYCADFGECKARDASFYGVEGEGVKFIHATLVNSDFSFADLKSANLDSADLRHCKLERTKFTNASMKEADLRGARLIKTSFHGAKITGANLKGVDLSQTYGLTREQLNSALIDTKTKLPEELLRLEAAVEAQSSSMGGNQEST
jgi:uncharacterized protein YjbI with pentapeptide repeats